MISETAFVGPMEYLNLRRLLLGYTNLNLTSKKNTKHMNHL